MSDIEALRSILTAGHLAEAAGPTYFERGEDYFETGLVRNLHFGGGRASRDRGGFEAVPYDAL